MIPLKLWPNTRLQPSVNLLPPVTAFMFSCSDTDVLPRRDESSGKPPLRIQNQTVISGDHYTTTATQSCAFWRGTVIEEGGLYKLKKWCSIVQSLVSLSFLQQDRLVDQMLEQQFQQFMQQLYGNQNQQFQPILNSSSAAKPNDASSKELVVAKKMANLKTRC